MNGEGQGADYTDKMFAIQVGLMLNDSTQRRPTWIFNPNRDEEVSSLSVDENLGPHRNCFELIPPNDVQRESSALIGTRRFHR